MKFFRFLMLMVMSFMISATALAQSDITVSGTVVDNTGEPVIGASVIQKGTSNGAVTDLDGKFSFKAPAGAPLTISYIGYH